MQVIKNCLLCGKRFNQEIDTVSGGPAQLIRSTCAMCFSAKTNPNITPYSYSHRFGYFTAYREDTALSELKKFCIE